MVVRLAESLELPLGDRNTLLLTAGFAPVYGESTLDDDALRPLRDALGTILAGHTPYPAVVVTPGGRLVAANGATDLLAEGAAPELLEPPLNILRVVLHADGMGQRVVNLPEWGRHVIEGVRASAARTQDPRRKEILVELERYVPPCQPWPGPSRVRAASAAAIGRRRAAAPLDAVLLRHRRGCQPSRSSTRGLPARRRSHGCRSSDASGTTRGSATPRSSTRAHRAVLTGGARPPGTDARAARLDPAATGIDEAVRAADVIQEQAAALRPSEG